MKYSVIILFLLFALKGLGQVRVENIRPIPQRPVLQKPIPQRPNQQQAQRQPMMDRQDRAIKINDKIKHVQELKAAFITKQLNLSPAENERFWPLYQQYQAEIASAQVERRLNNSNQQANGQEQLDKEDAIDMRIINIRKTYRQEFLKILPPEKVSQIYKGERDFNDQVIKHFGEKKDNPVN